MLRLYRVYEYYDLWKEEGQYIPNGQADLGVVAIDDTIDIKTLKRYLKKLFGLKSNIRLNNLWIDWDLDIIIIDYVTKNYGAVPIGHLDLIELNDDEEVEEELIAITW
mgnify:FL=1